MKGYHVYQRTIHTKYDNFLQNMKYYRKKDSNTKSDPEFNKKLLQKKKNNNNKN